MDDVYFPSEMVCAVWYGSKMKSSWVKISLPTVFLAGFTTRHAKLKLYSELDRDVFYSDADSIKSKSTGRNDPPLGNFLGEFTYELDGETIRKFISFKLALLFSNWIKIMCTLQLFSIFPSNWL